MVIANPIGQLIGRPIGVSVGSIYGKTLINFLSGAFPSYFTFTRASLGKHYNSAGVLTTAGVDEERFDYNPSTLAPMGLLVEGARTNLARQSEVFTNAFWTLGTATTITANTTVAPDGNTTADTYNEGGSNGQLRNTSSITVVSGSTYTFSAFIKKGNCDWVTLTLSDSAARTNGQQVWFNLTTGAKGTSSTRGTGWTLVNHDIQPINNGWYRCWIAVTTGATTSFITMHSGASDGSSSRADIGSGAGVGVQILTWGWQHELGAFPSSYIQTTSGTATRAADLCVAYDISRTNHIRNSTMVGGGVGVLPDFWLTFAGSGISWSVVGVNDDYIDVRATGTASAAVALFVRPEGSNTQIAAANGQIWCNSYFVTLVGGSLNGVSSFRSSIFMRDSGGTQLAELTGSDVTSLVGPTEIKVETTQTLNNASTAYVVGSVRVAVTSGATVDFTLRIRKPQLERRPFSTSTATPYIPTSGSAVTVYDSPIGFNASEGAIFLEYDFMGATTTNQMLSWFNDNTLNNNIGIFLSTTPNLSGEVKNAGTNQFAVNTGGVSSTVVNKSMLAYKINDFALVTNGGTVVTDNSGTIPTISQLNIGNRNDALRAYFGHIRRFAYYPTRLPDAQIQALTT